MTDIYFSLKQGYEELVPEMTAYVDGNTAPRRGGNGDIYPKEVVTATLRCEIELLKQKLKNLTADKPLYAMPPQQAFAEIYDFTFSEDIAVSETFVFVSEVKEIISGLENFPFM